MTKGLPLPKLLLLAPLLALASAGLAHEFWLQPARFRLALGETVNVRPLVGEHFQGAPWGNRASKILAFARYGPVPADSTNLAPAPGGAPADTFRTAVAFARPGTHLVVLRSNVAFIELPAAQFTAYLREEGLELPLRRRQERGQQALPGREAYRRCAKALVHVGAPPPAADTAYRRVLGLPLELVPEQNPYRLAPGAALTVRVLRAGQPVRGALVQVWETQPGGLPTKHFTTHANQNGRLLLRLSGPGPYLVATVDAAETPAVLRVRADWLSTWASLTFAGPVAR
ncbi:DUF4198 domain-containing protein [Hymenobacter coccineus]|uniref:DUF4198 domain-containing protein n=1 Tax=Hymenobacter coccineus TaxID=1908235 RepID=A0A1G1T648_9BACT|nr:DUF4198 domain-containing protein [Hymenobacter coccineus]OGX86352.1 hypothetical protein BEN49_10890 [Hymenobacter coccineus]